MTTHWINGLSKAYFSCPVQRAILCNLHDSQISFTEHDRSKGQFFRLGDDYCVALHRTRLHGIRLFADPAMEVFAVNTVRYREEQKEEWSEIPFSHDLSAKEKVDFLDSLLKHQREAEWTPIESIDGDVFDYGKIVGYSFTTDGQDLLDFNWLYKSSVDGEGYAESEYAPNELVPTDKVRKHFQHQQRYSKS